MHCVVQVHPDGRFEHHTFIPVDGKEIIVVKQQTWLDLPLRGNSTCLETPATNQHPSPSITETTW